MAAVDRATAFLVDTYGVMGNPVAHSKSPRIHALFAELTGENLQYLAIPVERGGFAPALDAFQQRGGRGVNVTLPFKGDAGAAMDVLGMRAERCGAVNTVWFDAEGRKHGDTTDGIGLLRDLDRLGISIAGSALLVLGAGGAVCSVLGDLLDRGPARLKVVNRTVNRAQNLAARFAVAGASLETGSYDSLAGDRFDVIINGTSLSLEDRTPPLPDDLLSSGACCYDMVYGESDTAFVRWAWSHGAAVAADGLGMLVEQAAESFYIWRGVRPSTEPVLVTLRGD